MSGRGALRVRALDGGGGAEDIHTQSREGVGAKYIRKARARAPEVDKAETLETLGRTLPLYCAPVQRDLVRNRNPAVARLWVSSV